MLTTEKRNYRSSPRAVGKVKYYCNTPVVNSIHDNTEITKCVELQSSFQLLLMPWNH